MGGAEEHSSYIGLKTVPSLTHLLIQDTGGEGGGEGREGEGERERRRERRGEREREKEQQEIV